MIMILEIITGLTTTLTGIFLLGFPLFGWKEVRTFLEPLDVHSTHKMLIAVGATGLLLFVSGILTLFNLIG